MLASLVIVEQARKSWNVTLNEISVTFQMKANEQYIYFAVGGGSSF